MKVDRSLGQKVDVGIGGESEGEGVGLEEGQGNLSRLLDDLSELSSEQDTPVSGHGLERDG